MSNTYNTTMAREELDAKIQLLHNMWVFYKPDDLDEPIEEALEFLYTEEEARDLESYMLKQHGEVAIPVYDYLKMRILRAWNEGRSSEGCDCH